MSGDDDEAAPVDDRPPREPTASERPTEEGNGVEGSDEHVQVLGDDGNKDEDDDEGDYRPWAARDDPRMMQADSLAASRLEVDWSRNRRARARGSQELVAVHTSLDELRRENTLRAQHLHWQAGPNAYRLLQDHLLTLEHTFHTRIQEILDLHNAPSLDSISGSMSLDGLSFSRSPMAPFRQPHDDDHMGAGASDGDTAPQEHAGATRDNLRSRDPRTSLLAIMIETEHSYIGGLTSLRSELVARFRDSTASALRKSDGMSDAKTDMRSESSATHAGLVRHIDRMSDHSADLLKKLTYIWDHWTPESCIGEAFRGCESMILVYAEFGRQLRGMGSVLGNVKSLQVTLLRIPSYCQFLREIDGLTPSADHAEHHLTRIALEAMQGVAATLETLADRMKAQYTLSLVQSSIHKCPILDLSSIVLKDGIVRMGKSKVEEARLILLDAMLLIAVRRKSSLESDTSRHGSHAGSPNTHSDTFGTNVRAVATTDGAHNVIWKHKAVLPLHTIWTRSLVGLDSETAAVWEIASPNHAFTITTTAFIREEWLRVLGSALNQVLRERPKRAVERRSVGASMSLKTATMTTLTRFRGTMATGVVGVPVPAHSHALNVEDVFLLDVQDKLFLWCGSESNDASKARALSVAKALSMATAEGPLPVVAMTSGVGDDPEFWHALGGGCADQVGSPSPYVPLHQWVNHYTKDVRWWDVGSSSPRRSSSSPSVSASAPVVSMLSTGGLFQRATGATQASASTTAAAATSGELRVLERSVANVPLRHSMLSSAACVVLDTGTSVYTWVGSKASMECKRSALLHSAEVAGTRRKHWVMAENEPPLFRALFVDWPGDLWTDVVQTEQFHKLFLHGSTSRSTSPAPSGSETSRWKLPRFLRSTRNLHASPSSVASDQSDGEPRTGKATSSTQHAIEGWVLVRPDSVLSKGTGWRKRYLILRKDGCLQAHTAADAKSIDFEMEVSFVSVQRVARRDSEASTSSAHASGEAVMPRSLMGRDARGTQNKAPLDDELGSEHHVFRLVSMTMAMLQVATWSASACAAWSEHIQAAQRKHITTSLRASMAGALPDHTDEGVLATSQAQVRKLRLRPGNNKCVDCSQTDPTWALVNWGAFVCIDCAAVHRYMGVHISRVRSTTLDVWSKQDTKMIERYGNALCNEILLAGFAGSNEKALTPDSPTFSESPVREAHIRAKWEKRVWADKERSYALVRGAQRYKPGDGTQWDAAEPTSRPQPSMLLASHKVDARRGPAPPTSTRTTTGTTAPATTRGDVGTTVSPPAKASSPRAAAATVASETTAAAAVSVSFGAPPPPTPGKGKGDPDRSPKPASPISATVLSKRGRASPFFKRKGRRGGTKVLMPADMRPGSPTSDDRLAPESPDVMAWLQGTTQCSNCGIALAGDTFQPQLCVTCERKRKQLQAERGRAQTPTPHMYTTNKKPRSPRKVSDPVRPKWGTDPHHRGTGRSAGGRALSGRAGRGRAATAVRVGTAPTQRQQRLASPPFRSLTDDGASSARTQSSPRTIPIRARRSPDEGVARSLESERGYGAGSKREQLKTAASMDRVSGWKG